MSVLFEMLESRAMFSVAPLAVPHVGSILPHMHTTVPINNTVTATLHFVGTATGAQGQQSKLSIDLTALASGGYKGVATHVNSDGTSDKYNVTFNSKGQMTLSTTSAGFTLQVKAQLSSNGKTIFGTYSNSHVEKGKTFSESGTISLTLSTTR